MEEIPQQAGHAEQVASSSPTTTLPHKRKDPPTEEVPPPDTPSPGNGLSETNGAADSQQGKDDPTPGQIVCNSCGEGISTKDEASGGFTVKHWEAHRVECVRTSTMSPEIAKSSPELVVESPSVPQKRRRAKRNEEERIAYLASDPYVAKFEAYRVLCASCDKWIRLRPNSTYCSIPWDAHRKSCLNKRNAKVAHANEDRNSLFGNDPYVRKFDAERVQCRACDRWIDIGAGDNATAAFIWAQHRNACLQHQPSSPAGSASTSISTQPSLPTASSIPSVPPPSKHNMAMVSSSSSLPMSSARHPSTTTNSFVKDLNPSNFPPVVQESRRRNAEQRAASLRSDKRIGELEPNRAFCKLCLKWVQLRQDSSYCAYPWLQHIDKCQKRHSANTNRGQGHAGESSRPYGAPRGAFGEDSDAMDEDSEGDESAGGDADEQQRRRAQRREERRRAKHRAAALSPETAFDPDADAEGEPDMLMDIDPPRLADLDSPTGRLDFVFRSVRYLFQTTHEQTDDLTIATLVTYLNAAMPPDKHEDFDTTEVTKAASVLHEIGDFVFQGDVIRLQDLS